MRRRPVHAATRNLAIGALALLLAAPAAGAPALVLQTLLEKTIFQVDVATLKVGFGASTARRVAPLLPVDVGTAAADSVARILADSRDARVVLTFQRDVGLDRFLDGITANLRRAREAGMVDPATEDTVTTNLRQWFAPVAARGLREGDRLRYTISGDTLRTVLEQQNGTVAVDQTDTGPGRRRAVLGGFLAPGSDFREGLLSALPETLAVSPSPRAPTDRSIPAAPPTTAPEGR